MNLLGLGRLETIIEALIVAAATAAVIYIGLHHPFLLNAAKLFMPRPLYNGSLMLV
jgi:hypothetical protein